MRHIKQFSTYQEFQDEMAQGSFGEIPYVAAIDNAAKDVYFSQPGIDGIDLDKWWTFEDNLGVQSWESIQILTGSTMPEGATDISVQGNRRAYASTKVPGANITIGVIADKAVFYRYGEPAYNLNRDSSYNGLFSKKYQYILGLENIDMSSVGTYNYLFLHQNTCLGTDRNNPGVFNIPASWANNPLLYNCLSMFFGCRELKYINFPSNFINSSTMSLGNMFRDCTSLIKVNLRNQDTSAVEGFGHMFANCTSLVIDPNSFDSGFVGSSATDMDSMFLNCTHLGQIYDQGTYVDFPFEGILKPVFDTWNTSNVIKANYLFKDCVNLTKIDLTSWDTSHLQSCKELFYGCSRLSDINVSNWNTSNVTNFNYIFQDCTNLTSIDLSNWDFGNWYITTGSNSALYNLFQGCTNLVSVDMSKSGWDIPGLNIPTGKPRNITYYSWFRNCNSLMEVKLGKDFKMRGNPTTTSQGPGPYTSYFFTNCFQNATTSNPAKIYCSAECFQQMLRSGNLALPRTMMASGTLIPISINDETTRLKVYYQGVETTDVTAATTLALRREITVVDPTQTN